MEKQKNGNKEKRRAGNAIFVISPPWKNVLIAKSDEHMSSPPQTNNLGLLF